MLCILHDSNVSLTAEAIESIVPDWNFGTCNSSISFPERIMGIMSKVLDPEMAFKILRS